MKLRFTFRWFGREKNKKANNKQRLRRSDKDLRDVKCQPGLYSEVVMLDNSTFIRILLCCLQFFLLGIAYW